MEQYVIKTSATEKKELDTQVAKFVFATNSPFTVTEHDEFVKLCSMLRPGYVPPSRTDVGTKLLDAVFEEKNKLCQSVLRNKTVCLSLDGWTNVKNDPIVCVSATDVKGDSFLVDTVDTSGSPHTAEYLAKLATESMEKCEKNLGCQVGSIVTDNTGNVKKMRSIVEITKPTIITYGCSSHLLNLFAHDLKVNNVKEQIVDVVKYFRNNHFASATYRQAGGRKLSLPSDVRWNSFSDCLEKYLSNWSIIVKVCDENRDKISKDVHLKVMNLGLKREAESMLEIMKPVAVALDTIQKNNCSLGDVVEVWKNLKEKLGNNSKISASFEKRYNQAMSSAHYLANLVHPSYCGAKLKEAEKEEAIEYANSKFGAQFLILVLKHKAKSFMHQDEVVKNLDPLEWWKSQVQQIPENKSIMENLEKLFSAMGSSAAVERIFSTFKLVQSELRNRLGNEKAAKLVFLYKLFNSKRK